MRRSRTVHVDAPAMARLMDNPTVPLREWVDAVVRDLRLLKELAGDDPAFQEKWARLLDLILDPPTRVVADAR